MKIVAIAATSLILRKGGGGEREGRREREREGGRAGERGNKEWERE